MILVGVSVHEIISTLPQSNGIISTIISLDLISLDFRSLAIR